MLRIATSERFATPRPPAAFLASDDAAQAPAVAVLLNAHAKQVTARVRRALSLVMPDEHVYFSESAEQASAIAEEVVSRRYRTVFTGGGDGTFVAWVNRILESAERRAARPPRFGILALGTGNAVAEAVGATRRHAHDLARYLRGEVDQVRRLDLLTAAGRRTPFAGVGIDAAVLNDYVWVKERLADTPLRSLGLGATGYGLAVACRSVPRHLLARRPSYCELVNVGRPAWRLDTTGARVGPAIGHGELLYAGPCMLAAASTVPYYGLGLKAFPFADRSPGMMQIRVLTSIGIPALLASLPRIWAGRFEHEALVDFHADRVVIRCEKPMPLQVGGDPEGWRDEVTFGMAPAPVEVVDFGPRAVA